MLAAERDEFGRESIVGDIARHHLYDCLHLFTEISVGYANHRGVEHLRVRDEEVLSLLRIDVDAT